VSIKLLLLPLKAGGGFLKENTKNKIITEAKRENSKAFENFKSFETLQKLVERHWLFDYL
jgi:hypothetical protein